MHRLSSFAFTFFSVTRFCGISPIRQDFRSFWQIFKCLICIRQNFEPTLALKICYWAIFLCCKLAKFRASDFAIWSHWLFCWICPTSVWKVGSWRKKNIWDWICRHAYSNLGNCVTSKCQQCLEETVNFFTLPLVSDCSKSMWVKNAIQAWQVPKGRPERRSHRYSTSLTTGSRTLWYGPSPIKIFSLNFILHYF